MNIFRVGSEAEARTIIGYRRDSDNARIPGLASSREDVVVLPDGVITGTGSDRKLSADPNVAIVGAGVASSFLSSFSFECIGSGGLNSVFGAAEWTLDLNGITSTQGGASSNFGGVNLQDASVASHNWRVINSDSATGGGNNLTLISRSTKPAVQGLFVNLEASNSNADCLSTKAGGPSVNTETLYRVFDGVFEMPGLGGSDQAVTPHGGIAIELYRSTLRGNPDGDYLAYVQADDGDQTTRSKLVNCRIYGEAQGNLAVMQGCLVDQIMAYRCRDFSLVEDTLFVNPGNGTGNQCMYLSNSGFDAVMRRVEVLGTGGGVGVRSAGAFNGSVTAVDVLMTDQYRGFDIRDGDDHVIMDSVIQASQYSMLGGSSPTTITATNVVSDAVHFGGDPGGLTIQDPLPSGLIDTKRAAIRPAVLGVTQPAIREGWSNRVLEQYDRILQATRPYHNDRAIPKRNQVYDPRNRVNNPESLPSQPPKPNKPSTFQGDDPYANGGMRGQTFFEH